MYQGMYNPITRYVCMSVTRGGWYQGLYNSTIRYVCMSVTTRGGWYQGLYNPIIGMSVCLSQQGVGGTKTCTIPSSVCLYVCHNKGCIGTIHGVSRPVGCVHVCKLCMFRMVEEELIPALRHFGLRFYAYNPVS